MKSKLALLAAITALSLTGCGGQEPQAGSPSITSETSPSRSTSGSSTSTSASPSLSLTPPASATPPSPLPPSPLPKATPVKPAKPVPTAADGTNYKACADARCEVAVRAGSRLPVKKSALGFTNVLVISRVSDGTVAYGAKGGCCSISTSAQGPGNSYILNSLKVTTVAVAGKTAILRLSPA